MIYKFRKLLGFMRLKCGCTIFGQAWANKDKKLVFVSLDTIYILNSYQEYLF